MGNFFSNIWNDLTGKSAAKQVATAQSEASAQNQAAIQKQLDFEKEKQARLNTQQDTMTSLAKEQLYGAAGKMGMMPQADQWTNNYLQYLQNAPDLEYNAEKGAIARQTSDANNQAGRAMAARGLNMTGLGALPFQDIAVKKAGMMGDVERRREQRKGESLQAGTQLTQNMLNQWLGMLMNAAGMPQLQGTQVPGMMMQNANQGLNSALAQSQMGNPLGESAGNLASSWLMNMLTKNKSGGGTTAAPGAGTSNPLISDILPQNLSSTMLQKGLSLLRGM